MRWKLFYHQTAFSYNTSGISERNVSELKSYRSRYCHGRFNFDAVNTYLWVKLSSWRYYHRNDVSLSIFFRNVDSLRYLSINWNLFDTCFNQVRIGVHCAHVYILYIVSNEKFMGSHLTSIHSSSPHFSLSSPTAVDTFNAPEIIKWNFGAEHSVWSCVSLMTKSNKSL